jgi:hypothetical protein
MSVSTSVFIQGLASVRRRLQWRDSLKAAWMTFGSGLGLTCLLLIAGRLWPLFFRGQLLLIGLSMTLLLFCLGQLVAWFRPISWQKLARLGDFYLRLDERLVTALELTEGRLETSSALQEAQLRDTFARLEQAPLKQAFPLLNRNLRLPVTGVLLALLVTVLALYLTPNPLENTLSRRAELADFLEAEITELEQIQAEFLAEAEPLAADQVEEVSDTLTDLIERLERARDDFSPEEALAALAEADQSLTRLDQERLAQEQTLKSLADFLAGSDFAPAQEAAQALQNGDVQQAAQALQQAGTNPPATQAQADALADTLNQAAAALAESNPALAQDLQQAANALQSGDAQAIQEALEQAAQQLAEAGDQLAALEQLDRALANIQQARQALAQQGQQPGVSRVLGEGQGQGSGSGREDPGPGAEGLYSVESPNGVISTDNGPNQNRLEDYSSVYAPDHLGGEGGPLAAPPQQGTDGGGFDIGETPPNPNREPGESTVPYTEVYQEYLGQASTALDSDYIPLGMKDYVRQYFGALEPGR